MNRIKAIIPFLLIWNCSFAQFIERADQRCTDVFYGKIIPIGTKWAIAARGNPPWTGWGPGHFVTAWDDAGDESWQLETYFSTTSSWNAGIAGEMIASSSGGLYLIGPGDECDIFGYTHLLEVDSNGTVLMDRVIEHPAIWGIQRLATHPLEHLALLGYNGAVLTNMFGDTTSSWIYPHTVDWAYPTKGLWATDSTLFLTFSEHLVRADTAGNAMDTLVLDEVILDMDKFSGDVLILTETQLHRVRSDLSIVSTSTYSADPGPRSFAHGDEQGYFQAGNSLFRWEEGVGVMLVLTPELFSGQELTGMAVRDGMLVTASTLTQHEMQTGLMRSHSFGGETTVHDIDIAIEQLNIDTTWLQALWQNPDLSNLYVNARATLRNAGAETIDSAVISHHTYIPAEICGLPSTRILLNGLSLATGASVEVTFDSLMVRTNYYFPTSFDVNIDVCLVAQSPNTLVDRAPSDNIACAALHIPLGLDDRNEVGRSISPNPFTDHILLRSSTTGPVQLTLLDATGREVFTSRISSSSSTARIDLPDLTEGVYLLRTTDDKQQWTGRLVRAAE